MQGFEEMEGFLFFLFFFCFSSSQFLSNVWIIEVFHCSKSLRAASLSNGCALKVVNATREPLLLLITLAILSEEQLGDEQYK